MDEDEFDKVVALVTSAVNINSWIQNTKVHEKGEYLKLTSPMRTTRGLYAVLVEVCLSL